MPTTRVVIPATLPVLFPLPAPPDGWQALHPDSVQRSRPRQPEGLAWSPQPISAAPTPEGWPSLYPDTVARRRPKQPDELPAFSPVSPPPTNYAVDGWQPVYPDTVKRTRAVQPVPLPAYYPVPPPPSNDLVSGWPSIYADSVRRRVRPQPDGLAWSPHPITAAPPNYAVDGWITVYPNTVRRRVRPQSDGVIWTATPFAGVDPNPPATWEDMYVRAARHDWVSDAGAKLGRTWRVKYKATDLPKNLTGWKARVQIRSDFRGTDAGTNAATVYATFGMEAGEAGIDIPDPTDGKIVLEVQSSFLALVPAGVRVVYDLTVYQSAGNDVRLVYGTFLRRQFSTLDP